MLLGWSLVRRNRAVAVWENTNDNLTGISYQIRERRHNKKDNKGERRKRKKRMEKREERTQFIDNKRYGTPDNNPLSTTSWSVNFVNQYITDFMFASGDQNYWLVTGIEEVNKYVILL